MTLYTSQIQTIQHKLALARAADPDLVVFDAESHHYQISPPCSEQHIAAFERDYGISLPECYRCFISELGNGGEGYLGSAAGPFYGIYALGDGVGDFGCSDSARQMQNPCVLSPEMSDQAWAELAANLLCDYEDEAEADAAYELAIQTVFGGLLILGTQGCNYYHALVLNGQYRGRVVNLSLEFDKPKFCYETNFLSWYERWLDEIISGDLLAETVGWFAYQKGGSAANLLQEFFTAYHPEEAKSCLTGLQNKRQLDITILRQLQQAFLRFPEHQAQLCHIVCKSDYTLAQPLLAQLLQSNTLSFLQCLHWYGGAHAAAWRGQILQSLQTAQDHETLCFAGYLLEKLKPDGEAEFAAALLPYTRHEAAEFRLQAYYFLAQNADKSAYQACFLAGLYDADLNVQRQVLQAICGWPAIEFLPGLSHIAQRYPEEQDYILSNLKQVLGHYGLTISELVKN